MNNFKLFESKHHVIYLYEEGQLYIGRSIVELKSKKSSIAQMTDEEWTDFGYVSRIYENALKKCFNATYFNWGCFLNNAYLEAEPNPQVHWQVRPRYRNFVVFNNREFHDEVFGENFLRKDKEVLLEYDFLEKIANTMMPFFETI